MIERLIIGSKNEAKVKEWSELLRETVSVFSISTVGNFPEPKETGKTFAENAQIKATHYARLSHEYVFAEDGGYEIEILDGLPGVKSRRILPGDKEGTDQQLIDYVLERLKSVPWDKRTVRLSFSAAVADPSGNIIFQDGNSFIGIVAKSPGPVLIPGYPFRTIHYLPELRKTYAALTKEEHDKYSHKKPVAERLVKFLSTWFM